MDKKKAPKEISIIELFRMFPDNRAAENWFESRRWPNGSVTCPDCESENVQKKVSGSKMPYRCRNCRQFFSVKKGTVMESSKIGLQKWAIATHQMTTNPKGVSSIQLAKELDIRQATAWYMMQRIREAFDNSQDEKFNSQTEVDEAFFGGKQGNKHYDKKIANAQGGKGKRIVAAIKDRETNKIVAKVIETRDREELQSFVRTT